VLENEPDFAYGYTEDVLTLDLPTEQSKVSDAVNVISVGETGDYEFTLEHPGAYMQRFSSGDGSEVSQVVLVLPPEHPFSLYAAKLRYGCERLRKPYLNVMSKRRAWNGRVATQADLLESSPTLSSDQHFLANSTGKKVAIEEQGPKHRIQAAVCLIERETEHRARHTANGPCRCHGVQESSGRVDAHIVRKADAGPTVRINVSQHSRV
jgi:hypothetical protein